MLASCTARQAAYTSVVQVLGLTHTKSMAIPSPWSCTLPQQEPYDKSAGRAPGCNLTHSRVALKTECNNTPASPDAEWQADVRGRRGRFGRCCSWGLAERLRKCRLCCWLWTWQPWACSQGWPRPGRIQPRFLVDVLSTCSAHREDDTRHHCMPDCTTLSALRKACIMMAAMEFKDAASPVAGSSPASSVCSCLSRALRASTRERFCSLATSAVSSRTSPCSSTLSRVREESFPNNCNNGGCLRIAEEAPLTMHTAGPPSRSSQ